MNYERLNDLRLLGLTIAYYRRAKGMTQAELAEAVHISRTHMSNIEAPNTKTSISLNLLFDIAEALDIPVKELFRDAVCRVFEFFSLRVTPPGSFSYHEL